MLRVVAELAGPVDLRLAMVDDRRLPVGLVLHDPGTDTMYPLPMRYPGPEEALRASVVYRDVLASRVAALEDALARDEPLPPSGWFRRSRGPAAGVVVSLLGLLATPFVPLASSVSGALVAAWTGVALLSLGAGWLRRQDGRVHLLPVGRSGALPEFARATLLLLRGAVEGNVLAPAVRLEDGAGRVVGYVVPASAADRPVAGLSVDALARGARAEIESARGEREALGRRTAERHRLISGVRDANRSLESLRELEGGTRSASG